MILASDGMFDNLEKYHILDCCDSSEKIDKICECLGSKAHSLSRDKTYNSPFAQHARAAGKFYKGGKEDDITVVTGRVKLIM